MATTETLSVPPSDPLLSREKDVGALSVPRPPMPTSNSIRAFEARKREHRRRKPYSQENALDDLADCRLSLQLFLESRMVESEQLLREGDPSFERLYMATGYALIEAVKALMSFEDKVCSSVRAGGSC